VDSHVCPATIGAVGDAEGRTIDRAVQEQHLLLPCTWIVLGNDGACQRRQAIAQRDLDFATDLVHGVMTPLSQNSRN
jgi:hypothetical protein